MFASEVLAALRSEGYDVSANRLQGAREAGIFRPKLKANILGYYDYRAAHVDQFREYVQATRPGPQPRHLKIAAQRKVEKRETQRKWD